MNTIKIAIVITRLMGVQFILSGIITMTYLPEQLLALDQTQSLSHAATLRFEAYALVLRVLVYVLCGVALYVAARPVAVALTQDLDANP